MMVSAKKLTADAEPAMLQWLLAGTRIPDRSDAKRHKEQSLDPRKLESFH